jgi:outer membrane lipoprotein-sorting protein
MKARVTALMMLWVLFPLVLTSGFAQPLTLQQVLTQMDERDSLRLASLIRYTCTRRYALENRRFRTTAELSVRMTHWYPGRKTFEVLAERGPSIVRQRVLQRMLEAETEASGDDVRERTRIISRNYEFQLLGVEARQGRPTYVLEVTPKASNKFSIRGKVWVDGEDFAIVRVEAVPAQNPSAWIRNTRVIQQYEKVGLVWLPLFNHSETDSFLFGHTGLTIDSRDCEVSQTPTPPASPLSAPVVGRVIMAAVDQLSPIVGTKQACHALAVPRATWYRRHRRRLCPPPVAAQRHSARWLSESEQSTVLACLHEERFQDSSPAQVYAALLDEGRFHCSIRTMYRLLEVHGESRERRDQLRAARLFW